MYTKPGEPALLVCSLNDTIQWKKNGKIVSNNEKIKIFRNVLAIRSRDKEDYGEYFCELRNHKGKGIRMTLIQVNQDGADGESTKFLIPFIIFIILFVCVLVAFVVLLLKRRSKLNSTIEKKPKGLGNVVYTASNNDLVMTDIGGYEQSSEEEYETVNIRKRQQKETDPVYTDLRDTKNEEKPVYQSLVTFNKAEGNVYEEPKQTKEN